MAQYCETWANRCHNLLSYTLAVIERLFSLIYSTNRFHVHTGDDGFLTYHLQEKSCEVSIAHRECTINWHFFFLTINNMQVWEKRLHLIRDSYYYILVCMSLIFTLTRDWKIPFTSISMYKLKGFIKFYKW